MNQNTFYTSQNLWDLTRVSSDPPFNILMKIEVGSSVNEFLSIPTFTAPLARWRLENTLLPDVMPESIQDSFIGMLSAVEAEKIKNELNLYRKRFDEDLNKRNKVLFRE